MINGRCGLDYACVTTDIGDCPYNEYCPESIQATTSTNATSSTITATIMKTKASVLSTRSTSIDFTTFPSSVMVTSTVSATISTSKVPTSLYTKTTTLKAMTSTSFITRPILASTTSKMSLGSTTSITSSTYTTSTSTKVETTTESTTTNPILTGSTLATFDTSIKPATTELDTTISIENSSLPDDESKDKENEATVRKLYGLSVVALVIVLWIGRSVTWRYDISFAKGKCTRKPRRISKKFEPSEIMTLGN